MTYNPYLDWREISFPPRPGFATPAAWVADLEAHRIPLLPLWGTTYGGWDMAYGSRGDVDRDIALWRVRDITRQMGMFAFVDRAWTSVLARALSHRRVLEVMAGAGWVAKAMIEHGCAWLATDDDSWRTNQTKGGDAWPQVAPVIRMDAREAVRTFGNESDILVCSWPYMDDTFAQTCALWGPDKPIIYIGENAGGCTADDTFFAHFREETEHIPHIPIKSIQGIHDTVHIGSWSVEPIMEDKEEACDD